MRGFTVDNWKRFEYCWNDPFFLHDYYNQIAAAFHVFCYFCFSLYLYLLCGLAWPTRREKACGEARNEARKADKGKGGGSGVVQQRDIDQGCQMVTRQPIVSSVCSVQPLFSVFPPLCQLSPPGNFSFLFVYVFEIMKFRTMVAIKEPCVSNLRYCCNGSKLSF